MYSNVNKHFFIKFSKIFARSRKFLDKPFCRNHAYSTLKCKTTLPTDVITCSARCNQLTQSTVAAAAVHDGA